ncbi:MAG: glycosyltransferase family 2 protein [Geobacteraceae bacterium]|nr:glycosyltransferase family 2 protein [Geobacteraceae bacterium]
MALPVISIVLPTFNGSRYLEESVESCLNQSFTNWELIIVDDASNDSTPQIIDKYIAKDCRIRSVRHVSNRKLPAALNTGFNLARGTYFTWTSDDNCYKPNALEVMITALSKDVTAAGVYAAYELIDEHGKWLASESAVDQKHLVLGNFVGPCFLYSRSIAEKIGCYDEELFLVEDYDYWLRVSRSNRMIPLKDSLYIYRTHSRSLTALKQREISKLHAVLLIRNLPCIKWLSPKQMLAGWLSVASILVQESEWKLAITTFVKAFKISPVLSFYYLIKIKLSDRSVLSELV